MHFAISWVTRTETWSNLPRASFSALTIHFSLAASNSRMVFSPEIRFGFWFKLTPLQRYQGGNYQQNHLGNWQPLQQWSCCLQSCEKLVSSDQPGGGQVHFSKYLKIFYTYRLQVLLLILCSTYWCLSCRWPPSLRQEMHHLPQQWPAPHPWQHSWWHHKRQFLQQHTCWQWVWISKSR